MEKETKKPAKKAESSNNTKVIAIVAIIVAVVAVVVAIIIAIAGGGNKGLVGQWYYEGNKNSYYYQFNEDGTGVYGYGQTEGGNTFTYKDEGENVVIKYDHATNENNYKYSIDGGTLTITDDFNKDVVYKK